MNYSYDKHTETSEKWTNGTKNVCRAHLLDTRAYAHMWHVTQLSTFQQALDANYRMSVDICRYLCMVGCAWEPIHRMTSPCIRYYVHWLLSPSQNQNQTVRENEIHALKRTILQRHTGYVLVPHIIISRTTIHTNTQHAFEWTRSGTPMCGAERESAMPCIHHSLHTAQCILYVILGIWVKFAFRTYLFLAWKVILFVWQCRRCRRCRQNCRTNTPRYDSHRAFCSFHGVCFVFVDAHAVHIHILLVDIVHLLSHISIAIVRFSVHYPRKCGPSFRRWCPCPWLLGAIITTYANSSNNSVLHHRSVFKTILKQT